MFVPKQIAIFRTITIDRRIFSTFVHFRHLYAAATLMQGSQFPWSRSKAQRNIYKEIDNKEMQKEREMKENQKIQKRTKNSPVRERSFPGHSRHFFAICTTPTRLIHWCTSALSSTTVELSPKKHRETNLENWQNDTLSAYAAAPLLGRITITRDIPLTTNMHVSNMLFCFGRATACRQTAS